MTTKELEDRLIDFAASIIELTDSLKRTRAGLTLNDQMSRSSISAALNYGESIGAESPKDFVHKLQVVLKELRETWMALRIAEKRIHCFTKNTSSCFRTDVVIPTLRESNA